MKFSLAACQITLLTTSVSGQLVGEGERHQQLKSQARRLFEKFATYEPDSLVTDHAAIDLDLKVIQEQLALGTASGFEAAYRVYQQGGHSKPVAKLQLEDVILGDHIPKGSPVWGLSQVGAQHVKGTVMVEAKVGEQDLVVQYVTSEDQSDFVNCQVGGLPNPNVAGCFASDADITLPERSETWAYIYNITTGNVSGRTIQRFSTSAQELMADCSSCPYTTFDKFYEYYEMYDYADHIIMSAFAGEATTLANGNSDFGLYGFDGKTEIIQKAMPYLSIWMYVIRELEDAIDDCVKGCEEDCNDTPGVNAWDEAVAFYTGSLESADGAGNLLYYLADTRCEQFKTCGERASELKGTSYVNHHIFREFAAGRNHLTYENCDAARGTMRRIETLMAIPLVQGTLRYAFIVSGETLNPSEKHIAEGNIFSMSVLPLIHKCSPSDAAIIQDNMRAQTNPTVDFVAVKEAFERNYGCLGITCTQVGGVWDDVFLEYHKNAEPCRHTLGTELSKMSDKQKSMALGLGISIGGIIFIGGIVCFIGRRSEKEIISPGAAMEQDIQEAPKAVSENREVV